MFPQPSPLVCVFFWDRLLSLLVGGNLTIVDGSKGVPEVCLRTQLAKEETQKEISGHPGARLTVIRFTSSASFQVFFEAMG